MLMLKAGSEGKGCPRRNRKLKVAPGVVLGEGRRVPCRERRSGTVEVVWDVMVVEVGERMGIVGRRSWVWVCIVEGERGLRMERVRSYAGMR